MDDLENMCRRIAAEIEAGERTTNYDCPECFGALRNDDQGTVCDECGWVGAHILDGAEWLNQRLDVEFVVQRDGTYLGARIAYTLGGPNIWIDTRTRTVSGFWGTDRASVSYSADAMDIDGAASELWGRR